MLAVNLANGTLHWATGQLPGAPPSIAVVAPGTIVLRGQPSSDMTEDIWGVNARTGAVMWAKACSLGCAVLPVGDPATALVVVLAPAQFTVS